MLKRKLDRDHQQAEEKLKNEQQEQLEKSATMRLTKKLTKKSNKKKSTMFSLNGTALGSSKNNSPDNTRQGFIQIQDNSPDIATTSVVARIKSGLSLTKIRGMNTIERLNEELNESTFDEASGVNQKLMQSLRIMNSTKMKTKSRISPDNEATNQKVS